MLFKTFKKDVAVGIWPRKSSVCCFASGRLCGPYRLTSLGLAQKILDAPGLLVKFARSVHCTPTRLRVSKQQEQQKVGKQLTGQGIPLLVW